MLEGSVRQKQADPTGQATFDSLTGTKSQLRYGQRENYNENGVLYGSGAPRPSE